MSPVKRKGFFAQTPARPEDELARQADVEALIVPHRTMVQDLPVERIRPNPYQARQQFDNLEELAEAIKAQGFTSRLRVRPDPANEGFFQLVYGERRLRAASLAGRKVVPCEIADHSDAELIEIGLAENIQRRDLTPLEEAKAFQTFIQDRGYTVRSLAEKIGKDKSYVQDRMELLRIPEDVQAMVAQRSDTLRVAREIARLPTPAERKPFIEGVIEGKLNFQEVRQSVARLIEPYGYDYDDDDKGDSGGAGGKEVQNSKGSGPAEQPDLFHVKPQRAARGVKKETPFERQLERDGRVLLATVGKWTAQLPELSNPHKELLKGYFEQLFSEFEALKEKLND